MSSRTETVVPIRQDGGRPEKPERFSITIWTHAIEALQKLMALTGLSKTEAINRSIQVHAFLAEQMDQGKTVMLCDKNGKLERVHIL